jgi:4-diphosphocytidyl-2-C-methyl-D-erythritol kinase
MLVFPNAKINLGLNIINKRPDGYHELETCFYPIPWKDVLEAVPAKNFSFKSTGISIPENGRNIVEKAYHILAKEFQIPTVSIQLHKTIPIGAGLGGGSADAAFALKLFNDLFSLDLDDTKLMNYAVQLGADCAFFIKNQPMYATGIGEQLSDIKVSLKGKSLLMVYPNIHISTQEAYSKIIPKKPKTGIQSILTEKSIAQWKDLLVNDFEEPLFQSYPILKEIKEKLYDGGALYAAMSGSGSCIYGIFEEIPAIDFDLNFVIWVGKL